MNWKIFIFFISMTMFCLLAWSADNYQVINLGTLGGSASAANSINNREWVAGVSFTSGDAAEHATLWRHRSPKDLGTLGGPSSGVYWPVKADNGVIVGISETADEDPNHEPWSCSGFFVERSDRKCVGFVWEKDVMTELPTLGGNNGYAAGANNKAQIVGWAENAVEDPTCDFPQKLQFRAVLWEPKKNRHQELLPFGDDSTSAATAINDKGQVVGISGECDRSIGRFSAKHAVIWNNGVPNDIGSFGGLAWHTPTAINNDGQVTGFSNFPGDEDGSLNAHAFFWSGIQGDPIEDLGAVGDDVISLAFGMNRFGHVVGLSIGASGVRAFLYKDGVMMDLNELVPPGSIYLVYANDINDAGEITGGAVDGAGEGRAFLAIPDPSAIATYSPQHHRSRSGRVTVPDNIRRMLRQRLGFDPLEAIARPQ
jgi:probable HAF family extracellular repeat protein